VNGIAIAINAATRRDPEGEPMTALMDLITQRRSIRHFDNQPVSDAQLHVLLEAVRWAPSWANTQCWEIVVARDAAVKAELQACLPPKGNPASNAMVQAPVVLVVCAKTGTSGFYKELATTKFGDWMLFDLGLATQNLCLAAHDMNLGTVIVGLFDHDKARTVLGLPAGYEVVSMLPVGHPAKVGGAPKRKETADFTHYDKW
jgi:nitroreductase